MFCDYHVHSNYSDDSTYLMEEVIKDAIKMNMQELCFTDHVDYGVKHDSENLSEAEREGKILNVDYPSYFKEIADLKKRYSKYVTIRQGMEFGIQTHTISQFKKLFHRFDFDFIILSCHQVDNQEFWRQQFQTGKTQKEYNERYYKEILEVIKSYKNYSVLGHLDSIKRYDEAGEYAFENVKDIITEILKVVIQDGKGIEVNTSSHRYKINGMTPSKEILMLYKKLGGNIITIGSDSHCKQHLGTFIEEAKKELKTIGFKSYCTFEHMHAKYHPL